MIVTTNSSESKVKRRARRDSIRLALLSTIALAGALPIAIIAPKVLSLIKEEHLDRILPPNPKQRLYETASRLKRKGLIEFRETDGKRHMHLTALGKRELQNIQERSEHVRKPRRWDRRWRIVIFDIPEKKHALRNKIRTLVQRIGFVRLQDSVWVYPYDCEEVIALLKTDLKVGRNVLYLIADAIEFDRPLREQFSLPMSD
jgi:DNA-binding PadR family transcriptional regulator